MSKKTMDRVIKEITLSDLVRYGTKAYNKSPQSKFKIIEDALCNMGVHVNIVTMRQRKYPKRVGAVIQRVYKYKYQLIIDYVNIKVYNTKGAAKNRIVKEYLKLKKQRDAQET